MVKPKPPKFTAKHLVMMFDAFYEMYAKAFGKNAALAEYREMRLRLC